ncbi:MAG: phosphoribosylformylglycinamidine synthase subunit PurQ [Planctomycetota bacterium]
MPDSPVTLLVRTAGTNCDAELAHAFERAGSRIERVHVDRLIAEPDRLAHASILAFPGGFSYGDDIASGRILATKLRERLAGPLQRAVDRGALVIGVCNGFQVLVQAGLLPAAPGLDARCVTLTDNASARFQDEWAEMTPEPASPCIWTRPLVAMADRLDATVRADVLQYPVAHAEGRLIAASEDTLDALEATGQVALRYGREVNGSARSIAGLCDPTGRVFGLMPHPERYLDWNRHPYWSRLPDSVLDRETPGLAMFRAAVDAARQSDAHDASSVRA